MWWWKLVDLLFFFPWKIKRILIWNINMKKNLAELLGWKQIEQTQTRTEIERKNIKKKKKKDLNKWTTIIKANLITRFEKDDKKILNPIKWDLGRMCDRMNAKDDRSEKLKWKGVKWCFVMDEEYAWLHFVWCVRQQVVIC